MRVCRVIQIPESYCGACGQSYPQVKAANIPMWPNVTHVELTCDYYPCRMCGFAVSVPLIVLECEW